MIIATINNDNNGNTLDRKTFTSKLSEQHAFLNAKAWIKEQLSCGMELINETDQWHTKFIYNSYEGIYQIVNEQNQDVAGYFGRILEY